MTENHTILLAIGDPNGIGPEIAVKAALSPRQGLSRILLVGDTHVIAHYSGAQRARSVDATRLPPAAAGVVDILAAEAISPAEFQPGVCNAASGRATIAYLDAAFQAAKAGVASAILACPHNETAVNAAGIAFSGYSSRLATLAGLPEDRVFLLLMGGGLRIVHATLHERLANALEHIDTKTVVAAGRAAHEVLTALGFAAPKIGVFGINPHAGENGLFGRDDDEITVPAVALLKAEGIHAIGPAGADLLLSDAGCDAYVAMYHDQGHIPIKLLAGRKSVAFSIGAGVLFASVGHGSAPDIAGQDRADFEPVLNMLGLISGAVAACRNELVA